jgi:hypothetical protein
MSPKPPETQRDMQPAFTLPMYSDELGRLPLHSPLDYTMNQQIHHHPQSHLESTAATTGYWYALDQMLAPDSGSPTHSQGVELSTAHMPIPPLRDIAPTPELHDISLRELLSMDELFYPMSTGYSARLFNGQVPTASSATAGQEQYHQPQYSDVQAQQHQAVHDMMPPPHWTI